MLVLSRKVGEQIVLPGLGVVLTVLKVKRGRTCLGVSAPPGVKVDRHEVWVRQQNPTTPSAPLPALTETQEGDSVPQRGGWAT